MKKGPSGELSGFVAFCVAAASMSACAFECSEAVKAKARDFIDNEKQFHLGFLPTEQSNPITATLEEDFKRSTLAGVQCLQRGDRQIPSTIRSNAHCYGGRVLLERGDVTNAVRHLRAAAFLGSEEATNRLKALRLRSR